MGGSCSIELSSTQPEILKETELGTGESSMPPSDASGNYDSRYFDELSYSIKPAFRVPWNIAAIHSRTRSLAKNRIAWVGTRLLLKSRDRTWIIGLHQEELLLMEARFSLMDRHGLSVLAIAVQKNHHPESLASKPVRRSHRALHKTANTLKSSIVLDSEKPRLLQSIKMTATDLIAKFGESLPDVELLTPSHAQWKQRRSTRGHEGQQHRPLGIAIPKTADHVASIVRWAKANSVEITVRTGGNDFYGRNAVDDGLIIDMRDIKFIAIADDRTTVTVGGGVISKDLIEALGKEGLLTPTGNTWIVGFVGWATLGGYGPLTNRLGMGFENIVGAEVVNSQGEIVQASEEMLEGIRGMGGNLGIITKLTVKVYPSFKVSKHAYMNDPCN